ncbi:MCPH1 [Lepeophtheirus salmonis]|uniref:MCPH1 n=2 Tax=Lepeophtheirus salmonis TaxID=72036 RepID=A0A7R8CIE5_LEPSM|nr:MCPH1 [Lepeophtheirus salmonis]CAF2799343.1 MCPH1 [Lepeophtheirus salmonis]
MKSFKNVPETPAKVAIRKQTPCITKSRNARIMRVAETPIHDSKRGKDKEIVIQETPPSAIKLDVKERTQPGASNFNRPHVQNGICKRSKSNMVCSVEGFDDPIIVKQIIHHFGYELSDLVTSKTTHIICCSDGLTQRTLNILRGILYGCWIVSKDWIFNSLQNGYLVDEIPYERVDFSLAVKVRRIEHLDFGLCGNGLLSHLGNIHVSRKSRFSTRDLGNIIRLAGGRISSNIQTADIIIGKYEGACNAICLTEEWLLDSIQQYSVMPYNNYIT